MRYSLLVVSMLSILLCSLMVIPLHAMFYRTTRKAARKVPIKSTPTQYQKAATTQNLLKQRAQIHNQVEPTKTPDINQSITGGKRHRFNFERSAVSTQASWGTLLTALGLGWLWYTSKDEDKENEEKAAQGEMTGTYITLEQFVNKFTPPRAIRDTIEAHKDAIADRRQKPYLIKGTNPPIYHKFEGIDRIINAELLKEVIKENNLNIEIPNKYLYSNPNNGKYEVFVEGMTAVPLGETPLTLKEAQEITTLVVETGITDLKQDNVLRNPKNNKFVILDTENMSFSEKASKRFCIEFLLLRFDRGDLKVSSDARTWVENYLKKLKDSKEDEVLIDMYASKRYNKLNISRKNATELSQAVLEQNHEQNSFVARGLWYMKHAMQPRESAEKK